ncbi:DUF1853 family protein [Acinetobacter tianfuensis]|uniref:DUF1853 family protein n=1 Tax=Acinetobacter tianfuensis TaxID=2419603 RepID=A0A3A8EWT6_9GAMM|nr:DUF1853 family protein [Acinetobacter tianfuensis]RKG34524.1 DUF1853 family protein [Acinetobacter tianfuensis]
MSSPFASIPLFEPWLHYKHPMVRQLAFAIASPGILTAIPPELEIKHAFELHSSDIWHQHYERYQPRLAALDQQPEELIQFVQQLKSTRLGLRFEMFIWFWLQDSSYHPYTLLGHSIQMIDGPRTAGELDFVLLNRNTQEIEHWEVALKYYLAERDLSLPYWYGLNRSDTLNRKLSHFTQKQFQFKHVLNVDIQKRYCVLKGQLYLPEMNMKPLPYWVNQQRRIGLWGQRIPKKAQALYRLERHEWICPNLEPSSEPAQWWTDGLYKQQFTQDYYMYRQPCLLQTAEF